MRGRLAVGLGLLLATAVASADGGGRHEQWCRAAVARLPVFHEDREAPGKDAELEQLAREVAVVSVKAPRPPREWAALHFAVGDAESNLSSRIIANRCKPTECDRGRARGYGQAHRNSLNGADWDAAPGNIVAQVKLTDDALRRAYWTCSRSGVPWLQGTLNAYAGKRCGAEWAGLGKRVATFNRLVGGKPGAT